MHVSKKDLKLNLMVEGSDKKWLGIIFKCTEEYLTIITTWHVGNVKSWKYLGRRNVIDAQKSGGGVAGKSDLWRDMWLASAILVLRV